MDKINVSTVKEAVNHIGLKTRHARNLVVDAIYDGKWKQERFNSTLLVSATESIDSYMKIRLVKHQTKIMEASYEGLTDEGKTLLKSLQIL